MRITSLWLCLFLTLVACQRTTPEPVSRAVDQEFTLTIGQSAAIAETGLTITFMGVTGDERCPSEIECAMSGPVNLTISVQKDSAAPVEFDMQTFTSNDGRAPEGPFVGIEDRVEYEGYLIQVKGVLPYPIRAFNEIRALEYQVTFLVTAP